MILLEIDTKENLMDLYTKKALAQEKQRKRKIERKFEKAERQMEDKKRWAEFKSSQNYGCCNSCCCVSDYQYTDYYDTQHRQERKDERTNKSSEYYCEDYKILSQIEYETSNNALFSEITPKDEERWQFEKIQNNQNREQSQNNSTSEHAQIAESRWNNTPYEKKYYNIFNLYYYVVMGAETRPQIGFATLKYGVFRDCSTYKQIATDSIISQCFVFEGENCRSDTWKCRLGKGVFFATTPSVKYTNYRVNFTYLEKEPRQFPFFNLKISDNNIKSYNSQTRLRYYDDERNPSLIFYSPNPYPLPFYYEKDNDIEKQPKLCLQLKDLEHSQQIINELISNSYDKIDCYNKETSEQKQRDAEFEELVF